MATTVWSSFAGQRWTTLASLIVHRLFRLSYRTHLTFALLNVCLLSVLGCEQGRYQLIGPPSDQSIVCALPLVKRITITGIEVSKPIAWQRRGYDNYPGDERVALAVAPNGAAYIAWLEANSTKSTSGTALPDKGVHITSLDKDLKRIGSDVVHATGYEVSGLVAHDDGFALLIRDTNPGETIEIDSDGNTVPFLVRYKNGQLLFSDPLTGSTAKDGAEVRTVYSPRLMGQLVWNHGIYGAYFAVKGGIGDTSEGLWRDLLVYRILTDRLSSPWPPVHGCTNNGGIRLIGDPGKVSFSPSAQTNTPDITGICVQQTPSMVKFTTLENSASVSPQDQEVGWPGYSGAKFGSLLKISDGYLVFWLSLGATNSRQGHDIRMAKLNTQFKLIKGPMWLTQTPGVEEWNVHVAPYGDRFLLLYNQIDISGSPTANRAVYLGEFKGTHLRLISADGDFLSEDEVIQGVPLTENDSPVVFPNGDVGWVFVNPKPDYARTLAESAGSTFQRLSIAKVRFCP